MESKAHVDIPVNVPSKKKEGSFVSKLVKKLFGPIPLIIIGILVLLVILFLVGGKRTGSSGSDEESLENLEAEESAGGEITTLTMQKIGAVKNICNEYCSNLKSGGVTEAGFKASSYCSSVFNIEDGSKVRCFDNKVGVNCRVEISSGQVSCNPKEVCRAEGQSCVAPACNTLGGKILDADIKRFEGVPFEGGNKLNAEGEKIDVSADLYNTANGILRDGLVVSDYSFVFASSSNYEKIKGYLSPCLFSEDKEHNLLMFRNTAIDKIAVECSIDKSSSVKLLEGKTSC